MHNQWMTQDFSCSFDDRQAQAETLAAIALRVGELEEFLEDIVLKPARHTHAGIDHQYAQAVASP